MNQGFNMSHPNIDGDSNTIFHVMAHKSYSKSEDVAAFYNNWAHYGLVVVPVVVPVAGVVVGRSHDGGGRD